MRPIGKLKNGVLGVRPSAGARMISIGPFEDLRDGYGCAAHWALASERQTVNNCAARRLCPPVPARQRLYLRSSLSNCQQFLEITLPATELRAAGARETGARCHWWPARALARSSS